MEGGRDPLILKNNGNCLFCQSPSESEENSLRPLLHSLQIKVKPEHQLANQDLDGFDIKIGLCNGCGNLNQTFVDLKQKMDACLATIKAKVKAGSEKTDGIDCSTLEGAIMNAVLTKLNRNEPHAVLHDLPLSATSIPDKPKEGRGFIPLHFTSDFELFNPVQPPKRNVGKEDNAPDCSTHMQSQAFDSGEARPDVPDDGAGDMEDVGEDMQQDMIQGPNSSPIYSESTVSEEDHSTSKKKKGESSKTVKKIKEIEAAIRESRREVIGKPRGRRTGYAFFVQTCREEIKERNPDQAVAFVEFSRSCSQKWKAMSAQEKAPFLNRAEVDKQRFNAEMWTYAPPQAGGRKKDGKKKHRKDPNAPKKALSAFFWFCNDERPKIRGMNPEYNMGDVAKELGRLWAQVDPQARERYNFMAERDKQRYQREMESYKKSKIWHPPPQPQHHDLEESDTDSDEEDDDDE